MSSRVYVNGVLRQFWNDVPRTYTEYNAAGAQTSTRAYTAAENAQADADAALSLANSNQASILQLLNDTMPTLDVITNTTNANMSGNTAAAAIKDEARALRRIIRILTANFTATN